MKEIVQDGAEILREVAEPVPEKLFGGTELTRIIEEMKEALDPELEGVALAAPQIGVPYRIFVVRKDRTVAPPPVPQEGAPSPAPTPIYDVYINPEIIKTSRKRAKMDEGCLSVRGVYGTTRRHERVTLRALDITGKKFERSAGGLMAQIFEHEVDHLNGVLFFEHAERLIRMTHDERPT
jgi:peptide deformylase